MGTTNQTNSSNFYGVVINGKLYRFLKCNFFLEVSGYVGKIDQYCDSVSTSAMHN